MKYPIGIQTFSEIIENGYVYIDKTALVHRLVDRGKYYFLSRPRRFGKSLLLSTLDAYFSGRRGLFKGLALEQLETRWDSYPVLHLDLNNGNFKIDTSELTAKLERFLRENEKKQHLSQQSEKLGDRFADLIEGVHATTGKRVVVLIDEYDKPIIANVERGKADLQDEMRNILKGFYGTLKTCDEHIRFAMLTGVSRFSKLSVFSDLNNLIDISMDNAYCDICGITEQELHHYFDGEVQLLADKCRMTKQEAYDELKRMYDGYRFSDDGMNMYNPWSVFKSLSNRKFEIGWSSTGTPTFLVKMLHDRQLDLTVLDRHIVASEQDMSSFDNTDNTVAALYQTGYLTIKDYNPRIKLYSLGVPNAEVDSTLNTSLLPAYAKVQEISAGTITARLFTAAQAGDVDGMMETLRGIIASAPMESTDERVLELNYRNLIAITFKLSGLAVHIEQHTCVGRIDLALEADERVYIFEFKRTTLAAAQHQIESRRYVDAYAADARQKVLVAVRLDDNIRNIADWTVL
ncbi:MAG: AAA family ATPase [Muribaculaceae bacterium]|nr:AAA family ATPase [Muribaculaceae bacterium]